MTLFPCDADKNTLLLSLSLLKCACSHALISFRICGKKGKVLKRENVHQSGKDVLKPNDVSLNEPPARAQFWSKVAGPPSADPSWLLERPAAPSCLVSLTD